MLLRTLKRPWIAFLKAFLIPPPFVIYDWWFWRAPPLNLLLKIISKATISRVSPPSLKKSKIFTKMPLRSNPCKKSFWKSMNPLKKPKNSLLKTLTAIQASQCGPSWCYLSISANCSNLTRLLTILRKLLCIPPPWWSFIWSKESS